MRRKFRETSPRIKFLLSKIQTASKSLMKFYKYHGAGNDFLIADGRNVRIDLTAGQIAALCDRHTGFGADGLMVLESSGKYDFAMRYYNPDGSGGMMCGNGGRCIVAFAADLGCTSFRFEAPDGYHEAELLQSQACEADAPFSGKPRMIRLKMADVSGARAYRGADGCASGLGFAYPSGTPGCDAGASSLDWYMDTGTRHLVRFVQDLDSCDVAGGGRILRYDGRFAPVGVNVDFVRINAPGDISVRTYEKGVEAETLACGTGIVASALASWLVSAPGALCPAPDSPVCTSINVPSDSPDGSLSGGGNLPAGRCAAPAAGAVSCLVHARIADLSVSFVPSIESADVRSLSEASGCASSGMASVPFAATEVYLTGPAAFIGTVQTPIV